MGTYKPEGYNSISPYLIVDGAQRMVTLLEQVFNAREMRRYDRPDGTIMHVEIQIDDSIIMLGDSSEKHPSNKHMLHVYVPNVDDTFQKAIKAGCKSMGDPTQQEGDPDKRGMFEDFAGNVWAIGTQS